MNGYSPRFDEYCALLDRALEDRRITEEESTALADLASDCGLRREEALSAHEAYFEALLRLALQDDVISEAEADDLAAVQGLLGIDANTRSRIEQTVAAAPPVPSGTREPLEGKTICFTGAMQCLIAGARATRAEAQQQARAAGMVVKSGVSKKLDILVLADPDSMSGKAKKARAAGVRLVAEPVFWQMVGVAVE